MEAQIKKFKLVEKHVSQDSVEYLEFLLEQAKKGELPELILLWNLGDGKTETFVQDNNTRFTALGSVALSNRIR